MIEQIMAISETYKKLRKDSEEAKCMPHVLFGQPNLYGLFMAKSLEMSKEDGRYILTITAKNSPTSIGGGMNWLFSFEKTDKVV